jgi:thiamine pyrophosphate-dependent acetolactate synthase large subunit-like protein
VLSASPVSKSPAGLAAFRFCASLKGRQSIPTFDNMAEALGCYAEYVEQPEEIRPALQRALEEGRGGMVGFVNVKTDYRARATTVRFSSRET